MGEIGAHPKQGTAKNKRQMLILHLTMAVLFLLDLALPREIPLLPYYFVVVLLSASFASPRQMGPLIAQAYLQAIVSGIYWGFSSFD